MKKGFTIIEVMLAGSIILVIALALFEGVMAGARTCHENSELLAADAYAWDVAWKRFNEDFSQSYKSASLPLVIAENLSSNAMPVLYYEGSPATCYVTVSNAADRTDWTGRVIDVNVCWGPANDRRILAPMAGVTYHRAFNHVISVQRSLVGRGAP